MASRQLTVELVGDSSKAEAAFREVGHASDKMADTVKANANRMENALSAVDTSVDSSEGKFMGLADLMDGLGGALGLPTEGITNMARSFGDMAGGVTGFVIPTVQKLWALIMANPLIAVAALVVALGAALIYAYNHCETFRNIVDAVFGWIGGFVSGAIDTVSAAITGVWNWVRDNWPLLLGMLGGPIGLAVAAVVTHFDTIKKAITGVKDWISDRVGDVVGFFTGLPGRITSAVSGMFDGIKNAFKGALNWVIEKWNSLDFTIGGWKLPFPPHTEFPSVTIGTPNLPTFATGGTVPGPLGMPTLAIVHGGEQVIPLAGAGAGGSTAYYTINVTALDASDAAALVVRAIDEYEARNGTRFARAS